MTVKALKPEQFTPAGFVNPQGAVPGLNDRQGIETSPRLPKSRAKIPVPGLNDRQGIETPHLKKDLISS